MLLLCLYSIPSLLCFFLDLCLHFWLFFFSGLLLNLFDLFFGLFGLFRLFWLLLLLWFFLLWLLFFNVGNKISSNDGLKDLRYSEPILSLIIFKDAAQSSFSCTESSIQHVNILFLFILHNINITSFFLAPHRTSRFLD